MGSGIPKGGLQYCKSPFGALRLVIKVALPYFLPFDPYARLPHQPAGGGAAVGPRQAQQVEAGGLVAQVQRGFGAGQRAGSHFPAYGIEHRVACAGLGGADGEAAIRGGVGVHVRRGFGQGGGGSEGGASAAVEAYSTGSRSAACSGH